MINLTKKEMEETEKKKKKSKKNKNSLPNSSMSQIKPHLYPYKHDNIDLRERCDKLFHN